MSVLIKNGRVWDGKKFFFVDILTKGKIIDKIEPNIDEKADFIFDASGKVVSCGLVDAHVHIAGISSDKFATNIDVSSLPFGVTAVADASGIKGDKALLDGLSVKNAVFVCAEIKNNLANFDNALQMLEKFKEKAVGIKIYFDKCVSNVTDITPLKQTVDFAKKHGLIVMVHSSNSPVSMAELLSVLREGDILTHAYHGGTNNVSDDNFKCIESAKNRGVIIDAGMAGCVHTDFKVFENAIKAGFIPDIISTDITRFSAFKRGGRYGLTACMSIARHLGMKEEDIFKAVTFNPAKALKMDVGYLKIGKSADVAVLEYTNEGFDMTDKAGNSIKSEVGYRNKLTVLNGEIIYKD